ncbi:MAG: hypothetical protein Kow0047_10930 [Anaerolineae bacterium]
MSETTRMWVEVTFNIIYLIVVWGLVIAMTRRMARVAGRDRPVALLTRNAFALLALGDTGHVGFRVIAYAQGGLEATFSLFGRDIGWVGLGALATAVTVTLFYVLMLEIWRARFDQPYGWLGYVLLAAAAVRLAIMALPANEWNRAIPAQPWSLYRNIPLMIQGLGVAYLILRDAARRGDRTFLWIGVSILVSYACYTPVILWVQKVPALGMLMIPKTLAYVAIAIIAYRAWFRGQAPRLREARAAA